MAKALSVGDRVFVNAGVTPKLIFTITEITTETGQLMACGAYGCFAIDLLRKLDADEADDAQIRDELFIPYRPAIKKERL